MVRSKPIDQILAAIKLSRLPGVGAKKFKELISEYGDPMKALANYPEQLNLAVASEKVQLDASKWNQIEKILKKTDCTFLGADDYPYLLAQMPEPPPYLFRKGALWPIPLAIAAIVGPRHCSEEGMKIARKISASLASQGIVIISGGALGIDSAAHKGALNIPGYTVLVTATGIDTCYPKANAELYRQVQKHGCILTELLPGTPPRRDFFPTRNRIVAGLANVVIIVEGKKYSGTHSTARHAIRLGRKVFAWPYSPNPELRELPELLISQGATPIKAPDPSMFIDAMKWCPTRVDIPWKIIE